MALLTKDKINQFGVKEEYWRVLNINLNMQYQYCDITLGAYASAETRDSNCEPMNIKKVRAKWSEDEFLKYFAPSTFEVNAETQSISENSDAPIASNNIYQRAYEYVRKRDNYFKDAVNC